MPVRIGTRWISLGLMSGSESPRLASGWGIRWRAPLRGDVLALRAVSEHTDKLIWVGRFLDDNAGLSSAGSLEAKVKDYHQNAPIQKGWRSQNGCRAKVENEEYASIS